jgi:hypothetical protein
MSEVFKTLTLEKGYTAEEYLALHFIEVDKGFEVCRLIEKTADREASIEYRKEGRSDLYADFIVESAKLHGFVMPEPQIAEPVKLKRRDKPLPTYINREIIPVCAVQFRGDEVTREAFNKLNGFAGGKFDEPYYFRTKDGTEIMASGTILRYYPDDSRQKVVHPWDWLVKDANGKIHVISDDVFGLMFEEVAYNLDGEQSFKGTYSWMYPG